MYISTFYSNGDRHQLKEMAVNIIFVMFMPCLFMTSIQLQVVDSTLNTPIEKFFIYPQNVSEENLTTPENCTEAFEKYSKSVINFTQCFMKYARPIKVCMNCRISHGVFLAAYQHLKNQSQECQANFFGSDQLGILDMMYKNGNSLWEKGYCQNCYTRSEVKNETERFFDAAKAFDSCMGTINNTNEAPANNTCVKCHDAYVNVSSSYDEFLHSEEKVIGYCMDVVDKMNMSRKLWSDRGCDVGFDLTIGFPNILTALTIGLTPLMFYLLARVVSRLEDVKLVRPKRKITVVSAPPPLEEVQA